MSLAVLAEPSLDVTVLSDGEVRAGLAEWTETLRCAQAWVATYAAEIERRSRRELGHAGLAQREGFRSGTEFVKRITGTSTRETRTLVDVGTLIAAEDAADTLGSAGADGEGFASARPWLRAVTAAVRAGTLGVEAANAIRTGLGEPTDTVAVSALEAAAERLVHAAGATDADKVARLARAERDDIDAAGIAERERARHEKRYLKLTPAEDGMTRISGLMDPENAALVKGAFDRALSPRRGGPRFTDADEVAQAKALADDPRSNDQLTHDAFVQMIRLATDADPGTMFGKWAPGVRIHVALSELESGHGRGYLEGESAAISLPTVERAICEQGSTVVVFDDRGQPLNLGREHRLFTRRQRIALAARDGGCIAHGCDAPPSWTEAHHIDPWAQHGHTDVADGVSLCRFHHMMVHNQGHRIHRDAHGTYWLHPPPDRHAPGAPPGTPPGTPVPLHSKQRVRLPA